MGPRTIVLLFGGAVLEEPFCWKVSGEFQLKLLIFITSGKDQSGSQPKEEWKNCSSSKYWGIALWNCPKHNEAVSRHFTGFQLHNDFVPPSHIDDILLKNWGFVATLTSQCSGLLTIPNPSLTNHVFHCYKVNSSFSIKAAVRTLDLRCR